jgi:hypothetical protein
MDWTGKYPPTEEQFTMLNDLATNYFVDNPIGWRERQGGAYDPILPDVKKAVENYGWEAFKFVAPKELPSDWGAKSAINRASTKTLMVAHLSDEGWCGHYDEATKEEFQDWVKESKVGKWELQGLLKALSYVLWKQSDEKETLCNTDFFVVGVGQTNGVDDEGIVSRIFQRQKNRGNVKGVLKMSDVMEHKHRGDLKKPSPQSRGGKKMDVEGMISVLGDMFCGGCANYDGDDNNTGYTKDGITFTLQQLAEIRSVTNALLEASIYQDVVSEPWEYEKEAEEEEQAVEEDDAETQGFPTPREFTLPEGWKIVDVEGNTMWEEEETEELVYPCEDVDGVKRYEWVPVDGSYTIREV